MQEDGELRPPGADANLGGSSQSALSWLKGLLSRPKATVTKACYYPVHEVERNVKEKLMEVKFITKQLFLFQRITTIRFSKILSSFLCCRPQAPILTLGFSNLSWSISPSLGTDYTHLCTLWAVTEERVGKWSRFLCSSLSSHFRARFKGPGCTKAL